jgi:hypothetical protein
VGKVGLDPRVKRALRPGEVVLLFGTGFGATNPVAPTDSVFSGADPLRTLPIIRFGNVSAPVAFGGVVSPGLYQFNLTVPEVPDGDVPITAQIRLELCSRAASSWSASNTKRLTRGSCFANRARQGREPPPVHGLFTSSTSRLAHANPISVAV